MYTVGKKAENAFLRKKTKPFPFEKFSKADIRALVKTMREVMIEANGIGLAANQIGLDISVFVAQDNGKFYSVFNPEIIKTSAEKSPMEEGCLSVPTKYGEIERPEKVTLVGKDQNGKPLKIKAWGMLARIFQHETDHLNGKLFIDRAKNVRTLDSSL